jgi:diadenosine tetraphosphatase ApaH/serine/threonine PP2A family protein phosphatase
VLEVVADHAARGAVVVKGNHDEAVVELKRGYFNETAAAAIGWTRAALGQAHKDFLASLPLVLNEAQVCFVHASAAAPERWEYVDSPAAAERSATAAARPYTFCGHVHRAMLYGADAHGRMVDFRPHPGVAIPVRASRAWLAIPGSAGQPRDGDPAAAYALFDPKAQAITFHRVAYDHQAAARKIRAAGLPEAIAYRVERGV